MRGTLRLLLLTTLFAVMAVNVLATHLRAGEITAQRVSCTSRIVRITLTAYIDTESGIMLGGAGERLYFGDGSWVDVPEVRTTPRPDLGQNMGIAQFVINHDYATAGSFLIRYSEQFRNGGVVNLDNPLSTFFYIETRMSIDLICNNSPVLMIPPIDKACVGSAFFHNPGAYDIDGDSLSYQMFVPKMAEGLDVRNYRDPNTREFYRNVTYEIANELKSGPPTFSIDSKTGTITWDSPGLQGEYNIAFLIKEWSKINGVYIQIGYVERDMQIVVEDCDNRRPELTVPADICVEAGTEINEIITGFDPDSDEVIFSAFSEVFTLNPPAFVTPLFYQASSPENPAILNFQWKTTCENVRSQPYTVVFKIADKPKTGGVTLVQFKTWNITVVAPAPKWNSATVDLSSKSAALSWKNYECVNAEIMQVWRRVDEFPFTPPECVTGMPDFLGYTKIAELPIGQTSFIDNNGGRGLASGAKYCYRLVAAFNKSNGAESYVSIDICLDPIMADAPVITHVTVDKTDVQNGQITVKWRSPFDVDKVQFPPPYSYEVYRSEGITGTLRMLKPHTGRLPDSTFIDTGINTDGQIYNYRVLAYDANNTRVDTSFAASSVRLEARAQVNTIELLWAADVPWSNKTTEFPTHSIYRGMEGMPEDQFQLLADVNVNQGGFTYVDQGLDNTKTYCYRVLTRGAYGNPKIDEPLLNFSQRLCAIPDDNTAPCKPDFGSEIIAQQCSANPAAACGLTEFSNTITWKRPVDKTCLNDIVSYSVFIADKLDGEFRLLVDNVRDTFLIDKSLSSYARCYKIQAVDRSGNLSEMSEQFCFDNCPSYSLPNVFSPNGDGCNDLFRAYGDPEHSDFCDKVDDASKCAKFVENVEFVVYDRWGKQLYQMKEDKEKTIYIRWDGLDNDHREVPPGVYFYRADVYYQTVDPNKAHEIQKGWVQLLRGEKE